MFAKYIHDHLKIYSLSKMDVPAQAFRSISMDYLGASNYLAKSCYQSLGILPTDQHILKATLIGKTNTFHQMSLI